MVAILESESDSKRRQKTNLIPETLKKDVETQKGADNISKIISLEFNSEKKLEKTREETLRKIQDTMKTNNNTEDIDAGIDKKSNVTIAKSEPDQKQIHQFLESTCNSPKINYDLQMLRELKVKDCSDNSDFEFLLENSSHEEKEIESSDTGKSKGSNRMLLNKRTARKERPHFVRKSPSPVKVESKNKQDEVSTDDSAEKEDLNDVQVNFMQSKYIPTQEERMKLAKMSVKLRYPVLPQHKVESTAGTRTLNQDEKDEFQRYAALKSGRFSDKEDKILRKNWKTFCLDNQWDQKNPKPFLFMKYKNKEFMMIHHASRKKFMQCLAHNLPDRSLYSVFHRFKNLYDPHKTGKYKTEEDDIIIDFIKRWQKKKADDFNKKDRKFAELAIILKRTRASVWRRYRILQKLNYNSEGMNNFCHSNK